MSDIKQQLYNQCLAYVQNRMDASQQAIDEAQKASNDDTKSSAGDKYETSREMMAQDTNRNLNQLNEANKLKVALTLFSAGNKSDIAETGSVVVTDGGNFYIAVSAGVLTADGERYFAVSPASPIGIKLKGQKKGGEFKLNDKTYRVKMVF